MANVLLLDDDDTLRGLLSEMLHAEGHKVIQSDNGLAAFNIPSLGPIDLMITDLFMPRVDGLEAILTARKDLPNLRIIAMSAGGEYVKSDFLTQTKAFGVAEVLHKPFRPKAFREAVQKVLATPAAMFASPVATGRLRARAS